MHQICSTEPVLFRSLKVWSGYTFWRQWKTPSEGFQPLLTHVPLAVWPYLNVGTIDSNDIAFFKVLFAYPYWIIADFVKKCTRLWTEPLDSIKHCIGIITCCTSVISFFYELKKTLCHINNKCNGIYELNSLRKKIIKTFQTRIWSYKIYTIFSVILH